MEDPKQIADFSALPSAPVVSVYMATFNHQHFLADAIEGVLNQSTNLPFELVIAEDASTDATLELALKYQRENPASVRVVFSERNVGARPNFKRTAPLLRGKFVAFCEGDDYWTDRRKLDKQIQVMSADPATSLSCHAANVEDARTGRIQRVQRPANTSRRLTHSELITGDGALIPTCSIVVRNDVLQGRPDWWEASPVGDFPLVLRAAQLGHVVCIDEVMATYRVNVPGSWTTTRLPAIERRIQHATTMARVLDLYRQTMPRKYHRRIRSVGSYFILDAVLRSQADYAHRRACLSEHAGLMTMLDVLIARASISSGRNLISLRSFASGAVARCMSIINDRLQPKC
jgi:glycosyltransferase involved in cell wall biosynthesis